MAVATSQFLSHIDTFLDYRKEVYQVSPETTRSNRIDLQLFGDFITARNYPAITGAAVMDFQYYLKKQRLNSGASINRKIFTLKSYAQFLRLEDVHLAENLPFHDVLKIRQGYRNRPDALTQEQLTEIFAAMDRSTLLGIRDYAVCALMYELGLRVGEVHKLDLEDLDLQAKKIAVTGKGNKIRTLYLNDELSTILTEWLSVRDRFCNNKNTQAFFISKKGKRLAIRTMEDNLKKILQRVSLKTHFNVTCHTLRHSFASHLNDKEVDVLVIQSLLGHSSPRSTHIYIHPSEKKVREALEKLPGVLYVKELIEKGYLNLNFQSRHLSRRE